MYVLKGFMVYGAMADNTVGTIAPLGELSTDSLTYAKEKGQYQQAAYPEPTLVSFTSENDDIQVPVPTDYATQVLLIGQWLFDTAVSGVTNANAADFQRLFQAEFDSVATEFETGPMVSAGSIWMPEWISYRKVGTESRIKLWFSDEAFSNQYDGIEIDFIPPIDNLDDFFKGQIDVRNLVNARPWPEIVKATEIKKGENPYTVLRTDAFDWYDPNDRSYQLGTYWTALIYGRAGNNLDIVKQLLVDWILANSEHTREEWATIFPDLFTNTEFIITPMWSQYAIPNKTLQAGVYSPTVSLARAFNLGRQTAQGTGYTDTFVSEHLRVSFIPYKSLAFLALGSPENRDGIVDFNQRWVDYLAVGTDSHDFNRMATKTQEWVLFFNALLKEAEHMTEFSDVPIGYNRVERSGVLYVSAGFDNIQYLVVLRSYLETIDPPHVG